MWSRVKCKTNKKKLKCDSDRILKISEMALKSCPYFTKQVHGRMCERCLWSHSCLNGYSINSLNKKVLLHFNFLWKKKILHLYYKFSGYYFFPWPFYCLCFSFTKWRFQTEDIWTPLQRVSHCSLSVQWGLSLLSLESTGVCSVSCDPAKTPLQHLLPLTVPRAPWFLSSFSLAACSRIRYLAVSSW